MSIIIVCEKNELVSIIEDSVSKVFFNYCGFVSDIKSLDKNINDNDNKRNNCPCNFQGYFFY